MTTSDPNKEQRDQAYTPGHVFIGEETDKPGPSLLYEMTLPT